MEADSTQHIYGHEQRMHGHEVMSHQTMQDQNRLF